jgi:hypothetical protein
MYSLNFCPQRQTLAARDFLSCEFNLSLPGARGERGESVRPVLVTGGPSEEIVTTTKSHPNRTTITRSLSSVSFTVSVQNEFLLSCRSPRMKPHRKWCTIAQAWALSSRWPWHPGGSIRPGRAEEEERPEPSDPDWMIEIRTTITLHFI